MPGLVVGEPESDHAAPRVLPREDRLFDRVGRVDGPVGGDDDADSDVVRACGVGRGTQNDLERSPRAAPAARCGAGDRRRARPRPRRRAASSTTSRVSRASASAEVRTSHAARYMPENAAKLPKPRIVGTSSPASSASSSSVSGRMAPSRWMCRWAFGSPRRSRMRRSWHLRSPWHLVLPATETLRSWTTYSAETPGLLWFASTNR